MDGFRNLFPSVVAAFVVGAAAHRNSNAKALEMRWNATRADGDREPFLSAQRL